MKRNRIFAGAVLVLCAMFTMSSCGSSSGAAAPKKEKKGIVLPEGDNATVTKAGGFTTVEFPATLSADDMQRYSTDLTGYLINAGAPISSDGGQYDGFNIYYYMHNSKEWLHKGQYASPQEMQVSRIKSIKIADGWKRLREFNTLMPLLDKSQEKKNDGGYQNEIQFGENRYIFFEIVIRE